MAVETTRHTVEVLVSVAGGRPAWTTECGVKTSIYRAWLVMAGGHHGEWRHDHRDGEVQLAFVGGAGVVMSTCRRKFGRWWSIEALGVD